MQKSQKKFFIGIAMIVSIVGYLIYVGIQETSVYYLTVTQAQAHKKSLEDVRIEGSVKAGTIDKQKNALGAKFTIIDTETANVLSVAYKGTLPDLFKDEIDVVIQGKFDQSSGVFNAHTLLTSCPSKYEASEEEEAKVEHIPSK